LGVSVRLSAVRQTTDTGAQASPEPGGVGMSLAHVLLRWQLFVSRLATYVPSERKLHPARYAYPHELVPLLSPTFEGAHLLLAEYAGRHFLRVGTSAKRRDLGNMLICGPTGSGKSQHITSQLLTWPHSAVVYDI